MLCAVDLAQMLAASKAAAQSMAAKQALLAGMQEDLAAAQRSLANAQRSRVEAQRSLGSAQRSRAKAQRSLARAQSDNQAAIHVLTKLLKSGGMMATGQVSLNNKVITWCLGRVHFCSIPEPSADC